MPNRIIHEVICTSESRNAVSSDAEVLMDRLTVKADDFGRFDARPAVIRGVCFPLRLKYWTEARVAACLTELEAQDIVRRYHVVGRSCLFFVNWGRYQRSRASVSKFPEPPADIRGHPLSDADIRGSRDVLVPVLVDDGIGGPGGEGFGAFYEVYPRKVGKRKAEQAWRQAITRAEPLVIIAGAERYRDDPNREDAYTAHPTTWLNRDGWNDAPLPSRRPTDNAGRLRAIAGQMRGDD